MPKRHAYDADHSVPSGGAFVLAWVVGIVTLPVGPALLHLPYGTAFLAMTGTLEITTPDTVLGSLSRGWVVSPLLGHGPFAALVIGIATWTRLIHAVPKPHRVRSLGPPNIL